MTKYSEMAANLRSQIESDRYKPGDKLPTTSELCSQFGVSKITVRRAMDELERDGLISRRRGSGTFVTGPQPSAQTSSFISSSPSPFPADVLEPNELNYTTVHEFSVTYPSARQAKYLHIDSDLFVYSLCRTHTKNSEVQVVEYTAIPMNLKCHWSYHPAFYRQSHTPQQKKLKYPFLLLSASATLRGRLP